MVASVSEPNLHVPMLPPRSPTEQPPLPPKGPSKPVLPPRTQPPPVVPPRGRSNKDKMLVQSTSWIGGLEGPQSPLHLDRHRSPSLDIGTPIVGHLSKKPPPPPIQYNNDRVPHQRSPPLADSVKAAPPRFAPTENGGHHKTPLPLPSTPSPETSPTTVDGKLQQDHVATSSLRGSGKSPAPPPPVTSSSLQSSGDYPPYDKLAPIRGGEFPPYDRLKPITVLPPPPSQLPSKPSHIPSVPPLPPRSTVDAHTLSEKDVRPPLPPKLPPKTPGTNAIPAKGPGV